MSLASAPPAQGSQPIPTLSEPSESEPGTGNATPRATADGEEKKPKKRGLFGFGKKKTEEPAKPSKSAAQSSAARSTPPDNNKNASPPPGRTTTASPIQTDHAHFMPSSPGRAFTSSPRLSSPAGSQIFERDVQESAAALIPNSPAIPSHIQTENYIPPVLDASSEAITDDHLDPDNVEIITHASHQPASVAVAGQTGMGIYPAHSEPTWADELAAFSAGRTAAADSASNYGSFDTTDVRRLSFISFADVVQAEQQQQQQQFPGGSPRDSMHLAGLTSLASAVGLSSSNNNNRSPSPVRSPVSSSGGYGYGYGGPGSSSAASPPTSKSGSVKGLDMSPGGGGGGSSSRSRPLGSPTSLLSMQQGGGGGPTVTGELAIETMSQALRRTGSGDFSGGGVRSFPASPV
ncbi:hypothetical protein VTK56DRAFT_4248 [Thermocarpiscus australiensis]